MEHFQEKHKSQSKIESITDMKVCTSRSVKVESTAVHTECAVTILVEPIRGLSLCAENRRRWVSNRRIIDLVVTETRSSIDRGRLLTNEESASVTIDAIDLRFFDALTDASTCIGTLD